MAVTIAPLGGLNGEFRTIRDADVDSTVEKDVADGPCTIYGVNINNAANAAISYIHFWNDANPTIGTTAPDMVLPCNASDRVSYFFPDGLTFATTALSYAGKTVGGTSGSTGPTSDVLVEIVID